MVTTFICKLLCYAQCDDLLDQSLMVVGMTTVYVYIILYMCAGSVNKMELIHNIVSEHHFITSCMHHLNRDW